MGLCKRELLLSYETTDIKWVLSDGRILPYTPFSKGVRVTHSVS